MIRIRQVKLSIDKGYNDLVLKVSKLLRVDKSSIKNIKYIKQSIDARDKNNILYVYE